MFRRIKGSHRKRIGPADAVRKRWAAWTVTVLSAVLLAVFGPAGSAAANPFGDQYARVDTNKCIDNRDGSSLNGNSIQIWECNNNQNQGWQDNDSRTGYYAFRNAGTGKCIDAYRGSQQYVVLWSCDGSSDQSFKVIRPVPSNLEIYKFESTRWPGNCLDIRYNSTANGALIWLHPCHDGNNQRWE
jgi:hypothetical protein